MTAFLILLAVVKWQEKDDGARVHLITMGAIVMWVLDLALSAWRHLNP